MDKLTIAMIDKLIKDGTDIYAVNPLSLAIQLADCMRENDRLQNALITLGCHHPELRSEVSRAIDLPNKDSDNG